VKRYLLTWAVRSAALEHFDIRVKEDLLRYERVQKQGMWFIMEALHAAYFCPTWNRASVTWRFQGKWFEVKPGEIPQSYTAAQIEEYCNSKCAYPAVKPTCATTTVEEHQRVETQQRCIQEVQTKATQTQHTGESKQKVLCDTITSLKQDVSTEKLKTARKTVECCLLRRKLKLKNGSVNAETQTSTADVVKNVNTATQTHLKFDSNVEVAANGEGYELVQLETSVGSIEVPACLRTAARDLDKLYQHEVGKVYAELLVLKERQKVTGGLLQPELDAGEKTVKVVVADQEIHVPESFVPLAGQIDAVYVAALDNAVEEVRAQAEADAFETFKEEVEGLQQNLAKYSKENALLGRRCAAYERNIKSMGEGLALVNTNIQALTTGTDILTAQNEALTKDRDTLQEKVQQLERKSQISRSVIERLQQQVLEFRS
jgi:hypothetical protein